MGVPARSDIEHELREKHKFSPAKARRWATLLYGLPWKYLRPLVQGAVKARHTNPVPSVALAERYFAARPDANPGIHEVLARQMLLIEKRLKKMPPPPDESAPTVS